MYFTMDSLLLQTNPRYVSLVPFRRRQGVESHKLVPRCQKDPPFVVLGLLLHQLNESHQLHRGLSFPPPPPPTTRGLQTPACSRQKGDHGRQSWTKPHRVRIMGTRPGPVQSKRSRPTRREGTQSHRRSPLLRCNNVPNQQWLASLVSTSPPHRLAEPLAEPTPGRGDVGHVGHVGHVGSRAGRAGRRRRLVRAARPRGPRHR